MAADIKVNNIDVDMISVIHRHDDGYIGFVRKVNRPLFGKDGKPKKFETLFSVKIDELKSCFPELAIYLLTDSYFTVNSFWRHQIWTNKLTKRPDVERKETNLRYLSACYVDLDFYNISESLSFADVSYIVQKMTENGSIPAPSIIANSGRGAYLLWLLIDEDNNRASVPPRAWPEKIILYKAINKAIGKRMTELSWDKRAFDGSRVLRVPGSIHLKADQIVKYQLQFNIAGRVFFYTLRELANFCGLPYLQKPDLMDVRNAIAGELQLFPLYRKTKKKGAIPNNIKGFRILNLKRIQDLITIEQFNGGFPKGCRRRRLTIYCEFLRKAGFDKNQSLEAMIIMAGNCKPPYPHEENDTPIEQIIKNVYSNKTGACRNWTNQKLCQELKITPELAKDLNLITILPIEITQERKSQPSQREFERQRRHAAIYEILRKYFDASIRETQKALNDVNINVSIFTLQKEIPEIRAQIQDELQFLKAS
jgi:hypothetical protein